MDSGKSSLKSFSAICETEWKRGFLANTEYGGVLLFFPFVTSAILTAALALVHSAF